MEEEKPKLIFCCIPHSNFFSSQERVKRGRVGGGSVYVCMCIFHSVCIYVYVCFGVCGCCFEVVTMCTSGSELWVRLSVCVRLSACLSACVIMVSNPYRLNENTTRAVQKRDPNL